MKIVEINEYVELVFKQKTVEVEAKVKELKDSLQKELEKQIPSEVKEFAKKWPQLIELTHRISLNGNGLSWDVFYLNENENIVKNINYKVTDEIYLLHVECGKIKKEFKEKKNSLTQIFKNLKTEKKILEVYPEFIGVIQVKSKMELQICKDSDIVNYLIEL